MKSFFVLIIFILSVPSFATSETLYVKSSKTKIKEDKAPKSSVVAVLNKGVKLEQLEKSGKFIKVKTADGKIGWVFKFKVTKKKPKGGGNLFSSLTGGSGISKEESSTGGSIRGLSKISKDYAKDEGIKKEHVDAVLKMETFKVSDEEIDKFMQEGNIGEYGG